MPQASAKKRARHMPTALSPQPVTTRTPLNLLRTGMPARDSIVAERELPPRARGGTSYTIIRTNQVDSYETPPRGPGAARVLALKTAKPKGDGFFGTARKAAKLSIVNKPPEQFDDLFDLIGTLPADDVMTKHKPKIKTTASSDRVNKEKRHVRVKAFLYAASREDDNDFHLILGRDPDLRPEVYMNMELSGLPPANHPSFGKLDAVRTVFKDFFERHETLDLPRFTYDFYHPPIPVIIEGSLFFDMTHAKGGRPGPQDLVARIPTIWEIHPVTEIVFEP